MPTQNTETLHKIVSLQSCIIQGRNIPAMLHKDREFYSKRTQADIIAIYVNENDKLNIEYIVEPHHQFKDLVERYIFHKKNISWDNFVKHCKKHFILDKRYYHTKNFAELFRGFISKKKALAFSKELKMKDAVTIPLYDYDNNEEIGYVCFMYQKEVEIEITELLDIKIIFETLLRPLYDDHYSIVYSKCIRIDEHLKLLTAQEKRIARKVMDGLSYPEIAERSNISLNTVKTHMKNIFKKYQVNSKIELYHKLTSHI